jgi:hypothetical protein
MNLKTFNVRAVSKCHIVSQCVISLAFPIPTAPASKNNNPATSRWRCHRKTAAGDRVSAPQPIFCLGQQQELGSLVPSLDIVL